MADIRVTLLECDRCGGPLDGLRHDAVFTCLSCRRALVIDGGEVTAMPVFFGAAAAETPFGILYLPFWRMEVTVHIRGASEARLDAIEARGVPSVVWIPAFHTTRTVFFGDPGIDLTGGGAEVLEVEEIPDGARLVGATRTPALAAEYARLVVAELVDRGGDITDIEIDLDVEKVTLWGLPFGDDGEGGGLVDLAGGVVYSRRLVEDLTEIAGSRFVER